ncbi:uncharacterized protein LOC119641949 [Glossina fuscipes]|uniref:Uncharacterized protein LOC119641949 n=2 Tax=Nemorhina TaxID=44051 RepID=A0A9C6DYL7_9MUSC|nr:uncharacterized protein LOC119641949 [Glossina fuscipes]
MIKSIFFILLGVAAFSFTQAGENNLENEKELAPSNYYISNNVPKNIDKNCELHFECKKKLKQAEVPKPCLKFCLKYIQCQNGTKVRGSSDQCLELNEQLVAEEYNDCAKDGSYVPIVPVAMIDFPCQPGYLPDSRGRCREVW